MAKQTINIGSSANDGTGDPVRTAFNKVNQNFTEVYEELAEVPVDISDLTDVNSRLFPDVSDLPDTENIIEKRYASTRRSYTVKNIDPSSLRKGNIIPQDISQSFVSNFKDTSIIIFHAEDDNDVDTASLFENAVVKKQSFELYVTDNQGNDNIFLTRDVEYVAEPSNYRGYQASYNTIYNTGKKSINQIVIYEEGVTPTANTAQNTGDNFTVSGLTGSTTIGVITIFGSTDEPIGRGQLWSFFKEFVDSVLYTASIQNAIETIKTKFYENIENLKSRLPSLYPDLHFYANNSITASSGVVSGGSGSGAAFSLLTGRYEGESWRNGGIINPGSGYEVGDTLTILGTNLGGTANNNVSILITGVDGSGEILDYTISGTATNVWPINSIQNGGSGQYNTTGNIINTNISSNVPYASGNRVPSSALGNTPFGVNSSYNALYKDSIFAIIAKSADITSLNFSGTFGNSLEIKKTTGSLSGVKGYKTFVENISSNGQWVTNRQYNVSYSYAGYDIVRIPGFAIDNTDIENWNTAYSWGNHNDGGYVLNNRPYAVTSFATGVITHNVGAFKDFLYKSPIYDWTINLVDLNLSGFSTTEITITVEQGAVPFLPVAVQIEGVPGTINWQGGVVPTGTANGVDVVTFSIVSDGPNYLIQAWIEKSSGGGGLDISNISGDLIPSTDSTYDLGSATNQWRSLYVSSSTIFVGGTPISVDESGNLLVDGSPAVGGTSLPYVELTNDPFITLPAIIGETVTVTAAPAGTNARYTVVIGEEGVIDSVTVTQAGSGYVVGQRYLIQSFNTGGVNDDSGVVIVVATVNGSGGILTITVDGFFGPTHSNTPGTYTNADADYQPSVFDAIDDGLTLTRDNQQALFNSESETEYDNSTYLSPLGTEWNADGWGDLVGLRSRSYTTLRSALNNQVGNNIVASELVMHDTINDKYYKFDFSSWGQSNAGGFAYTRNLITDPNFFKKENYATGEEATDVFIEDDGEGGGIGITRANNNSIYNPYREEEYDEDVSPAGTLWNVDGYDDLTDITTRTYQPFYAAYDGNLGNRVPGSKSIMYIPETEEYYAIEWLSWTQNNNGGGFSYIRREIDLTKIDEGIKFADGTVLKTATGVGRVKSTASGNRSIEEVSGNKTINVTARVITNLTTVASRSVVGSSQVWVDATATTIDNIIENPQNYSNAYNFQFSLDNTTWYNYDGGYSSSGNERGFDIWPGSLTYDQGDTVYFRYSTGGAPVVWWDKTDLPGGAANFRGAVIDYHAYSGEATWIGTIHIVDDSGEEHISHTEVASGSTDSENDDLWLVQNEGTISYRRIDGEAKTLKVHWTAKVFYGSEYYD